MQHEAAAAYDAIAPAYDALRPANAILDHMRRESLAAILARMPARGEALEVGCGTGEEAVAVLASRPGLRLTALDPSPGMLAQAAARARGAGVADRLRLVRAAASGLAGLRGPFDAAWSSFALSYEPDLAPIARALASHLRPGAPLVVSLRNPWCAAEWWSIPARATGRYRHKVGAARVRLAHAGLRAASEAFAAAGFRREEARALPLLLPPPRYGRLVPRAVAEGVSALDRHLGGWPVLRALGDHTLLVLRRGEPSGGGRREGRAPQAP